MVEFNALTDEQQIERFGRLAKAALDRFGMPMATLRHQSYMENVLFEVSDKASDSHASLRICRPDWKVDALEREVCWLSELGRDTDLRVPIPIPTLDGELFAVVTCEGIPEPRACVLFHWVDGAYAAPGELTPARLRSVGQFLAKLHDHAETFHLPAELAIDRFDADALDECDYRANVSSYFEGPADLEAFDDAVAAAVKLMRELGESSTVAGIIHGDFHQRNYVFDGDHIGAIDFETMRWGYYFYDLATTLSYLRPEFLGNVDPEPLRASLIEGYATERRLPKEYERTLRIFAAYRVWIMADWVSSSPRMLKHDWARRRLDAMPEQIRDLLEQAAR